MAISMGKFNKPVHTRCRRCGRKSFHLRRKRCGNCGYGATAKWRRGPPRTKPRPQPRWK
ncbi:MAG: 50S ribosomal protein L37e [Candidatus Bathyarchaeia archaeon]